MSVCKQTPRKNVQLGNRPSENTAVRSGKSTAAVFFVGLFQFFFWLVFCMRPDAAQNILHLDHFQGHSSGFLAGVLAGLTFFGRIGTFLNSSE